MVDDGSILPMYEEVRRKIYFSFEQMKKANSWLQVSTNKSEKKFRMITFKERYLNFVDEINSPKKIKKIDKEDKKFLISFSLNRKNLNTMSLEDANKIVKISVRLIEELGITNIQYVKKDNPFPMA